MSDKLSFVLASCILPQVMSLPREDAKKANNFLLKFERDPQANGLNLEKLNNTLDGHLYSARISDDYRAILKIEKGTCVVVCIDHHDKAYKACQRRKYAVNPHSGALQNYEVPEMTNLAKEKVPSAPPRPKASAPSPKVTPSAAQNPPSFAPEKLESPLLNFANFTDEQFINIDVPEELLPFLRTLTTKEELEQAQDFFPADAFEHLRFLAEDFSYEEVLETCVAAPCEVDVTDLQAALQHPVSRQSFKVIENQDDLQDILAKPLETWRVFLHPQQRNLATRSFSGPVRVLGTAGTGKTVVAMHRAKFLAAQLAPTASLAQTDADTSAKVLFVTYNSNLAEDIKINLKGICTPQEFNCIEVTNLDAWVVNFIKKQGLDIKVVFNEDGREKLWQKAMVYADASLGFRWSFYEEEWVRVVLAQNAMTWETYALANRNGRGIRLDRRKRRAVWTVLEQYQKTVQKQRSMDYHTAYYECAKYLAQQSGEPLYKHVLVDEVQDFGAAAMHLLRLVAGKTEHTNDLFLTGDAHQRIYKTPTILSHCGINVCGRGYTLRVSYRTTEEIRQQAIALLKGMSFDNFDNEIITDEHCKSLTHGPAPTIQAFPTANLEFDFVTEKIKELQAQGVALRNICIVARTSALVDGFMAHLQAHDVPVFLLKNNTSDASKHESVRLATMHRVKGLEFAYMFIVSANKGVFPREMAPEIGTDPLIEQECFNAEKCLLYVAMTRAQKAVFISGFGRLSPFLASVGTNA